MLYCLQQEPFLSWEESDQKAKVDSLSVWQEKLEPAGSMASEGKGWVGRHRGRGKALELGNTMGWPQAARFLCGHAETSPLYLLRAKIKLIILFQPVIKANFGGKHWKTVGEHNVGRVVGKEWWPWNGAGALWAAWSLLMWTQRQQQQLTGWAATHLPSSPATHSFLDTWCLSALVLSTLSFPHLHTKFLPLLVFAEPSLTTLCANVVAEEHCSLTQYTFPGKALMIVKGRKWKCVFEKLILLHRKGCVEKHWPNEVI